MGELFQIKILGASAAVPTSLRHTTTQVLQYHNKRFLLDCAEGAQMQIRRHKVPLMKINHIFISHLHGDHYLGLPGLLFTKHLLGRTKKLHVYSPPGLREIIELQYKISELKPSFDIEYHEIGKGNSLIFEDQDLKVLTLQMKHRIPTFGFLFVEKEKEKNIIKKKITKYKIPVEVIPQIKNGADFVTEQGTVIPNNELTLPPPPSRKYAFCSDTAYTEEFLDQIRGVDLLYHEATFLHDKAGIAREKMHTTTIEAATLARKANVKKLLLGHYSARYKELDDFLKEAKTVFPNTIIAEEGEDIQVSVD